MKKFVLFLLLNIFIFSVMLAQKQAANWYCGQTDGLFFGPTQCEPQQKQFHDRRYPNDYLSYAAAAMSDSSGNLLFYTDGDSVYGANHLLLKNGYDIFPIVKSYYPSLIIIPNPGYQNIYYIIGARMEYDAFMNPLPDDLNTGLRYSIVDLNGDNGKGAVTQKNVMLNKRNCQEMTAVYHRNGKDVWLITHDFGVETYRTYLITKDGFTDTVLTNIGDRFQGDPQSWGWSGCEKASPDGKKLGVALGYFYGIHLFDFNDSTGILSNFRKINIQDSVSLWYLEFSPDSKKMYSIDVDGMFTVGKENCAFMYQIDATKNTEAGLVQSMKKLSPKIYYLPRGLQLTPDGRIAMVMLGDSSHSAIIECPNMDGDLCNLKFDWLPFFTRYDWCMPMFIQNWFALQRILKTSLNSNSPVCDGDVLNLNAADVKCADFEWTGPNGYKSFEQNPAIKNVDTSYSGTYYCKVSKCESYYIDSIKINVNKAEKPIVLVNGMNIDNFFCEGDTVELSTKQKYIKYNWSTGDTTETTHVPVPKQVFLNVIDSNGCSAETEVNILPKNIIIQIDNPGFLHFGKILQNTSKTDSFKLYNRSNEPIEISGIKFLNQNNIFKFISPAIPHSVNAMDSVLIKISFNPDTVIAYNDTLIINILKPCKQQINVSLDGEGLGNLNAEIWLPDTTGSIGMKNFHIPLKVRMTDENSEATVTNVKVCISFDADVYYPKRFILGNLLYDNLNYPRWELAYSFDSLHLTNKETTIADFAGWILLTQKNFTNLTIDTLIYTTTSGLKFDFKQGVLNLNEICVKNLRQIESFKTLTLAPTPVMDKAEISYETVCDSYVTLKLINTLGVETKIFTGYQKAGEHNYELRITDYRLSSGIYFLQLRYGDNVENLLTIILR